MLLPNKQERQATEERARLAGKSPQALAKPRPPQEALPGL